MMVTQKHGISALGLKRTLGIGSEQTAWAILHRYRRSMVRPGRERLQGVVEVDETFFGGPESGRRGRGAKGKTLVEIAVEQGDRGLGRCRMQVIESIDTATIREFLLAHVEPGAAVVTDGLRTYIPACAEEYEHRPEPIGPSGMQAHELLPAVHRVAALAKRWLLGTQGVVFIQRTCRRTSTSSPFASTGDAPAHAACSSIGCSSKLSRRSRAPIARSWPAPARPPASRHPRRQPASESVPRAWLASRSTVPGAADAKGLQSRHSLH